MAGFELMPDEEVPPNEGVDFSTNLVNLSECKVTSAVGFAWIWDDATRSHKDSHHTAGKL